MSSLPKMIKKYIKHKQLIEAQLCVHIFSKESYNTNNYRILKTTLKEDRISSNFSFSHIHSIDGSENVLWNNVDTCCLCSILQPI